MFGKSKLSKEIENLTDKVNWLNTTAEHLVSQNMELKKLILENRRYTLENKVEIQKEKSSKVIEKIVEVPKVRKHKRKALRTSKGWTMISQEEKAEFMTLYNQGLTMMEISQSTGRSVSAISRYLHGKLDGTEPIEDGHH